MVHRRLSTTGKSLVVSASGRKHLRHSSTQRAPLFLIIIPALPFHLCQPFRFGCRDGIFVGECLEILDEIGNLNG